MAHHAGNVTRCDSSQICAGPSALAIGNECGRRLARDFLPLKGRMILFCQPPAPLGKMGAASNAEGETQPSVGVEFHSPLSFSISGHSEETKSVPVDGASCILSSQVQERCFHPVETVPQAHQLYSHTPPTLSSLKTFQGVHSITPSSMFSALASV